MNFVISHLSGSSDGGTGGRKKKVISESIADHSSVWRHSLLVQLHLGLLFCLFNQSLQAGNLDHGDNYYLPSHLVVAPPECSVSVAVSGNKISAWRVRSCED